MEVLYHRLTFCISLRKKFSGDRSESNEKQKLKMNIDEDFLAFSEFYFDLFVPCGICS